MINRKVFRISFYWDGCQYIQSFEVVKMLWHMTQIIHMILLQMAKLEEKQNQNDRKMTNDTIPSLLYKELVKVKATPGKEGDP